LGKKSNVHVGDKQEAVGKEQPPEYDRLHYYDEEDKAETAACKETGIAARWQQNILGTAA
jgi:hypothetical protein